MNIKKAGLFAAVLGLVSLLNPTGVKAAQRPPESTQCRIFDEAFQVNPFTGELMDVGSGQFVDDCSNWYVGQKWEFQVPKGAYDIITRMTPLAPVPRGRFGY